MVAPTASQPTVQPAIQRPLDAGAYRENFCGILPDGQAKALGFPGQPEAHASSSASRCYRVTSDPPSDLALYFAPRDLLGEAYRKPNRAADYFKPTTISGQPAVEMGSHDVLRERILLCTVVIGLTSSEGVEIAVDDTAGGKACERAISVGTAIVHNLGG